MIVLWACLAAALGLAAGWFVNLLADRVPAGSPLRPLADSCAACGARLPVRAWLPVIAWVGRGRRCPECGAATSFRRPLVELATAAVFAGLVFLPEVSWALPGYWWAAATAITLTVTDLEHRRIPDRILMPGLLGTVMLLAAGALADGDPWNILRGLAGGAAHFGLLLVVAVAARGGFGFGDVKLGLLLGLALAYRSWGTLTVGIFAGFAVGGLAAVALLAARRVNRRSFFPFGPAMVAGAAVALAYADAVVHWYLG